MRLIYTLFTLGGLAFGGWYALENIPSVRSLVHEKVGSSDFCTLEIRYSAEEIMRAQREHLLKKSGYTFLDPQLFYYPYLLMDVKYTRENGSTMEGSVLWGLSDGEMVIDTGTWEKTHGFEDCLLANATKHDFKILQALVEHGGIIDREKLYKNFKIDHDIVDEWIDSCRSKKLIANSGNNYRLHFEKPRLVIQPTTNIAQALVSHPPSYSTKIKKRYSLSQIKRMTQTAFGDDFAIRKTQEVFLPVHRIGIQNPDGSTRTLYFNALTGKEGAL